MDYKLLITWEWRASWDKNRSIVTAARWCTRRGLCGTYGADQKLWTSRTVLNKRSSEVLMQDLAAEVLIASPVILTLSMDELPAHFLFWANEQP